MNSAFCSLRAYGIFIAGLTFSVAAFAQNEPHGRKYVPPPATTHIVVTVEKAFNGKPMESCAVIFHAVKNGKDTGNLEVKTNTNGEATMDLIEAGSHVTVQVFANGYATDAEEFDVTAEDKRLEVKLKRPRAQQSNYVDNTDKPSTVQPGTQEHIVPKPAAKAAAQPASQPVQAPPVPQQPATAPQQ